MEFYLLFYALKRVLLFDNPFLKLCKKLLARLEKVNFINTRQDQIKKLRKLLFI